MNHTEYAQQILALLHQAPVALPPIEIDDTRRNNAARCMTALACNRLAAHGEKPHRVRYTTFDWNGGVLTDFPHISAALSLLFPGSGLTASVDSPLLGSRESTHWTLTPG